MVKGQETVKDLELGEELAEALAVVVSVYVQIADIQQTIYAECLVAKLLALNVIPL